MLSAWGFDNDRSSDAVGASIRWIQHPSLASSWLDCTGRPTRSALNDFLSQDSYALSKADGRIRANLKVTLLSQWRNQSRRR
ncbi:hypothetical protein RchiOBHm_Chr2g0111731 [Rosa chinensis]|uniref:Uncharacterized protein n=1 Tax=Rosa chinensis TaxID=74649 RepID=A0A2P6RQ47_ROSCH|nr:hypothetical protein RchiOBHm_Chr2g0111731 [Rosa chinensis]